MIFPNDELVRNVSLQHKDNREKIKDCGLGATKQSPTEGIGISRSDLISVLISLRLLRSDEELGVHATAQSYGSVLGAR